jgi:hypothetical protein
VASAVVWKHNRRGNSENEHKELKSGMVMEPMPCGQFEADAMYFAIGVLAYNIGPTPETPNAARRVSHGDRSDTGLEGVSVSGQVGAPRARVGTAD